ncbi:MAG: hypothetical protein K2N06_06830 [Oscillospiraceae bacterium]|nr:hypothetical protein [Oscillospiraceae bacterium]
MKTYEEMTRDVLARRDKELINRERRRKTALRIGIPSVAVAGVVGLTTLALYKPDLDQGGYVHLFVGEATSGAELGAYQPPNLKPNNIVFNDGAPQATSADIYINPDDFEAFTLEEMNSYYGLKIDAFSDKYPEWTMNLGKLGIYAEKGGTTESSSGGYDPYYQQNTLWWELGEKEVSVEVNMGRLPIHCVVYEFGDDAVSVINNTDVTLYHFAGKYPNGEPIDSYYARFMYSGCGFEINAKGGVTEEEFIKIVELYTDYTGVVGNEKRTPKSENIVFNDGDGGYAKIFEQEMNHDDFDEYTLDGICNYYGYKVAAFSDEYPEWTMKQNKYGTYIDEGNDGFTAWCRPYWTQNDFAWTLDEKCVNITVDKGDKIPDFGGCPRKGDKMSVINNLYVYLYYNGKQYSAAFTLNDSRSCGFKITARNVTEEEFIKIVRLYTTYEKMTIQNVNTILIGI